MKKYTYRKFLILLFMINLIAITAVYINTAMQDFQIRFISTRAKQSLFVMMYQSVQRSIIKRYD